jgi:DNA-binding GntR family transcriptional regulator
VSTRAGGVYDRLREDILTEKVAEGAPLVELDLATRYGTSRTPVREALRRLEHDGLIERHDRSFTVRATSPEQVLEIYEIRIALEGIAARSAAEHRSSFHLARLRGAIAEMRATDTGNPRAMAAANLTFHQALWSAGRNATLIDLLGRLQSYITRYPATTLAEPGRWEQAIAEHTAMVDAIEARDEPTARRIAEEHMTTARAIRLRHALAASGDNAAGDSAAG